MNSGFPIIWGALEESKWKKRKFNWGNLSVKLSKIRKDDLGCITIKVVYK